MMAMIMYQFEVVFLVKQQSAVALHYEQYINYDKC